MKAEYIITVDWDDSLEDDVDLWVRDPNGEIVSYLQKDAGWLHLDRDDRGVVLTIQLLLMAKKLFIRLTVK